MGVMQVTCQEEKKGIIIIIIIEEGRGGKGWQETVTVRIKHQTERESCHLKNWKDLVLACADYPLSFVSMAYIPYDPPLSKCTRFDIFRAYICRWLSYNIVFRTYNSR